MPVDYIVNFIVSSTLNDEKGGNVYNMVTPEQFNNQR